MNDGLALDSLIDSSRMSIDKKGETAYTASPRMRREPQAMTDRVLNVRARAPLRLGLAGGGTDLSPYCDEHGGAVLNATIDRFAYSHVFPNDHGKVVFRARDVGEEETVAPSPDIPVRQGLILHRAVYAHVMRS